MGTKCWYCSSGFANMNNLSIFCLLATLVAVSCYSIKQEPLDYCVDTYDETLCNLDRDNKCHRAFWIHSCPKTCAYRDVWTSCSDTLDFFCSRFDTRQNCLKSCYERDCTSKKIIDKNTDEERILLK